MVTLVFEMPLNIEAASMIINLQCRICEVVGLSMLGAKAM